MNKYVEELAQEVAPGIGQQAWTFNGRAGFVELDFAEAGQYTFVNHAFVDAGHGAMGVIEVVD